MAERRLPRHTRVQMQCSLRQTPRPARGLCAPALSPRCNWAFEAGKTICSLGKGGHPSPTAAAPVLPADSTQGTPGRGRGRSGASTPPTRSPPAPRQERGATRGVPCADSARRWHQEGAAESHRPPGPCLPRRHVPTRVSLQPDPATKPEDANRGDRQGDPRTRAGRGAPPAAAAGWDGGRAGRPAHTPGARPPDSAGTGPDRTRSPAAARTCTYARQRGPRCVRRRPAAAPVPASAVPALGGPPRRPPHHMIRADISQPGTAPPPARAAPSGRRGGRGSRCYPGRSGCLSQKMLLPDSFCF